MTYLRYSTRNVPYQRHCNFSDFASAHGQGDCALAERDLYFSTSHRARRLQRLSRMSRSRLRTMLELLHSHEPSKHAVLCRYPHLSLQNPDAASLHAAQLQRRKVSPAVGAIQRQNCGDSRLFSLNSR